MRPLQWIIVLMLLWIGFPRAYADRQTLELGARATYGQVTLFRGSDIQSNTTLEYRNGFAFGISARRALHRAARMHFGVESDLLFVRRGAEVESAGVIINTFQLSYLEIPVLGRALLPLSGPVEPYIVAGPRFGLLLSSESIDFNGNVRDESDATHTFDFGFSAGAGAAVQVGSRTTLTIEGRYDQSLMNRIDFHSEEVTNDQRHRAFFLLLGVSMGIGGAAAASAKASHAP
jgi:opacity protein-like surface antigen